MTPLEIAKQHVPLPDLMQRLGLGERAKKSARCPFHEDRHNSFSVWQKDGAWFWKCHAGCGGGDEINFLEKHKTVSRGDAIKLYLEMAGVNGATPNKAKVGVAFDWRSCVEALTEKHVERLAKWRGYSREFCSWLKQNGLVGLYDGGIAFPVHDRAGVVVAAHCRQKDNSWRYAPHGVKASPLVIGDMSTAAEVHIFESQWDAFAFWDRLTANF